MENSIEEEVKTVWVCVLKSSFLALKIFGTNVSNSGNLCLRINDVHKLLQVGWRSQRARPRHMKDITREIKSMKRLELEN